MRLNVTVYLLRNLWTLTIVSKPESIPSNIGYLFQVTNDEIHIRGRLTHPPPHANFCTVWNLVSTRI